MVIHGLYIAKFNDYQPNLAGLSETAFNYVNHSLLATNSLTGLRVFPFSCVYSFSWWSYLISFKITTCVLVIPVFKPPAYTSSFLQPPVLQFQDPTRPLPPASRMPCRHWNHDMHCWHPLPSKTSFPTNFCVSTDGHFKSSIQTPTPVHCLKSLSITLANLVSDIFPLELVIPQPKPPLSLSLELW